MITLVVTAVQTSREKRAEHGVMKVSHPTPNRASTLGVSKLVRGVLIPDEVPVVKDSGLIRRYSANASTLGFPPSHLAHTGQH